MHGRHAWRPCMARSSSITELYAKTSEPQDRAVSASGHPACRCSRQRARLELGDQRRRHLLRLGGRRTHPGRREPVCAGAGRQHARQRQIRHLLPGFLRTLRPDAVGRSARLRAVDRILASRLPGLQPCHRCAAVFAALSSRTTPGRDLCRRVLVVQPVDAARDPGGAPGLHPDLPAAHLTGPVPQTPLGLACSCSACR